MLLPQKSPSSLILPPLSFPMFSSKPLSSRLKKVAVMLKVLLPRLSITKPSLLRSILPLRLAPRKRKHLKSVMRCLITTDLLPSRM